MKCLLPRTQHQGVISARLHFLQIGKDLVVFLKYADSVCEERAAGALSWFHVSVLFLPLHLLLTLSILQLHTKPSDRCIYWPWRPAVLVPRWMIKISLCGFYRPEPLGNQTPPPPQHIAAYAAQGPWEPVIDAEETAFLTPVPIAYNDSAQFVLTSIVTSQSFVSLHWWCVGGKQRVIKVRCQGCRSVQAAVFRDRAGWTAPGMEPLCECRWGSDTTLNHPVAAAGASAKHTRAQNQDTSP